MAVTNIPNVQNWTVTPQNGQAGYFTLMNTWLGQSTLVIASLQTAITAQNTANSEINALAIQTENNAIVANGLANFQGAWSGATTYSKGQSVESTTGSKIYYTSKVDSNLNHALTDTNYWLYSPINDKLDKDFSILTDKATPSDTDIFAIRESGGLLKKLSWANLKATLKTYFDTLYMGLTGNQTVAGVKTFSSNIVGNITGNAATATWAAAFTTAVGSAPSYACRAWVNFNGTGTVAIRASGNVSSITDNGVGIYKVNFATAMPDSSYSAVGSAGAASGSHPWSEVIGHTTSSVNLYVTTSTTTVAGPDVTDISLCVFR